MLESFQPQGNTIIVPVTSTGGSTTLQISSGAIQGARFYNEAGGTVYVALSGSSSSIAATAPTSDTAANGFPIPSGVIEVYTIPPRGWISAVSTNASGRLFVTPGFGV